MKNVRYIITIDVSNRIINDGEIKKAQRADFCDERDRLILEKQERVKNGLIGCLNEEAPRLFELKDQDGRFCSPQSAYAPLIFSLILDRKMTKSEIKNIKQNFQDCQYKIYYLEDIANRQ